MQKKLSTLFITTLAILALAACGGGGSDQPEAASSQNNDGEVVVAEQQSGDSEQGNNGQGDGGQRRGFGFDSQYLSTEYDGAASPNSQLIIGTLQLEDTDQAITTAQATKLLPFWIALQSGAITNQAESNAVLKQIESAMGAEQMQAIAAMGITNQSIGEWAAANGIEMPQGGPGGPGGAGGRGGQDGPLADMTEEERAKFREEMQGLSQEERQARLAELGIEFGGRQGGQGGGGQGGDGQGGGAQGGDRQGGRGIGGGRLGILMEPLIEMLTERASG